jgi:hypothetical protein
MSVLYNKNPSALLPRAFTEMEVSLYYTGEIPVYPTIFDDACFALIRE